MWKFDFNKVEHRYLRKPLEGNICDYHHSNQYYWHVPQVTSIKSNYRMIVCWLLLIITSYLTHLQYVNIECTASSRGVVGKDDMVHVTFQQNVCTIA